MRVPESESGLKIFIFQLTWCIDLNSFVFISNKQLLFLAALGKTYMLESVLHYCDNRRPRGVITSLINAITALINKLVNMGFAMFTGRFGGFSYETLL